MADRIRLKRICRRSPKPVGRCGSLELGLAVVRHGRTLACGGADLAATRPISQCIPGKFRRCDRAAGASSIVKNVTLLWLAQNLAFCLKTFPPNASE